MPNTNKTAQENINEIHRLLSLISGAASQKPLRGRDIEILTRVKEIQAEPLHQLQKFIENHV